MRYIFGLFFLFPTILIAEEAGAPFLSSFEIGVHVGMAEASEGSFEDTNFLTLYIEKAVAENFTLFASIREFDKFVVNQRSRVVIDYDEKFVFGLGTFGRYNKKLSGYARINAVSWELNSSFSGNELASESDVSFGVSLGVKYQFLNKLGLNVEFSSVQDVSDADINSLSAGLFLLF